MLIQIIAQSPLNCKVKLYQRYRGRPIMMNGSGMAMGFGWIGMLLILVLVFLAIAALIKYLRS